MILEDAIVERVAGSAGNSPLLGLLASPRTICEIVEAARAEFRAKASPASAESVLLELLALDAAGSVRISPAACGASLRSFYETRRTHGDRSLAYVATYERNWQRNRHLYDFVAAGDANAARKAFQMRSYLGHLGPHLDRLRAGERVLDAGCGVGRLTEALLARALRVTCADASAEALKCALRIALRGGATLDSLDARLCDVRDLSCFEDATFAATLALEVICYQEDPAVSLRELVRITRPGGLVAVSVEGLHGSCIVHPELGPAERLKVLDTGTLDIEDELSVRYFTKAGLRTLLEAAGLGAIEIVGTHYTADGVFDQVATDAALTNEEQLARLLALESAAAADPVLEPLARAWLATARVPAARP